MSVKMEETKEVPKPLSQLYKKRKFSVQKYTGARRGKIAYNLPFLKPLRFLPYADRPNKKVVKLRYVDHFSQSGIATATPFLKEYRANSMYDPDFSGVGHQPYGFDQLMTGYKRATVIKSYIRLESLDNIVASKQVWQVVFYTQQGTVANAFAAGGPNGFAEIPNISKTLVPSTGTNPVQRIRSCSISMDFNKVYGKRVLGDDQYSCTKTADAPIVSFYGVVGYTPDSVEDTGERHFKVTLIYTAILTEPEWFTTS